MPKSPLRLERERRGWTLEYVAERVNVSAVQISRIEIDGVKAAETARELVRLFGTVSLDQVCDPKSYMPNEKETAEPAELEKVS